MTRQAAIRSGAMFICPSIRPINPFQKRAVSPINLRGNMGVRCIAEFIRINTTAQGGS